MNQLIDFKTVYRSSQNLVKRHDVRKASRAQHSFIFQRQIFLSSKNPTQHYFSQFNLRKIEYKINKITDSSYKPGTDLRQVQTFSQYKYRASQTTHFMESTTYFVKYSHTVKPQQSILPLVGLASYSKAKIFYSHFQCL